MLWAIVSHHRKLASVFIDHSLIVTLKTWGFVIASVFFDVGYHLRSFRLSHNNQNIYLMKFSHQILALIVLNHTGSFTSQIRMKIYSPSPSHQYPRSQRHIFAKGEGRVGKAWTW